MSNTTKNLADEFFLHIQIAQFLEGVVWSISEVIHPTWLFFWNPTPGAVIKCGEQRFEAGSDHAYLIPPYTTLSASSRTLFAHLYAHFDAGVPFKSADNRIYQLDPAPARRFFCEHRKLGNPRRMLYWRIMLMEYLAMLPEDALNSPASWQDNRICKLLESLNGNWQSIPDNQTLARRAGMSVNSFYRHFREMLGISPQRYLMSIRLSAARNMLMNETENIERIASCCGFSDRYSFSKAFKQYFGIAPGAFRRGEQMKDTVSERH